MYVNILLLHFSLFVKIVDRRLPLHTMSTLKFMMYHRCEYVVMLTLHDLFRLNIFPVSIRELYESQCRPSRVALLIEYQAFMYFTTSLLNADFLPF